MALLGRVGHRHSDAYVRVMPVRGECLRSVNDPATILLLCLGARPACVGTSLRLGQRPAPQLLALRQRHNVFLLLLFAAEFIDVIGAQRIVCGHDDSDRAVHTRQFLDDDRVFRVAHPGAAVLLRKNHAQKSHLGQLGYQFGRKLRGLVPFHHMRQDFAFGELTHRPPKLFLFVRQGKFHGPSRITIIYLAVCFSFISYGSAEGI